VLIERAQALGEPAGDPMLLFSVLYWQFRLWATQQAALDGDVVRELAVQFLARAQKQTATVPLMIAHRLMGPTLLLTGDIVEGQAHLDRAIPLYDPAEHRHLAAHFGQDVGVAILFFKSLALWLLGHPETALTETDRALKIARETGDAATLMYALTFVPWIRIQCGNYATADAQVDEAIALADEKDIVLWKGFAMMNQGQIRYLTARATDAVEKMTSALAVLRSTGATSSFAQVMWMPLWLLCLTKAYADLGRFEDSKRSIDEALTVMESTKDSWCEAEVNRLAGEIALLSLEPDLAKAEMYFERALAIARRQQAKSWELRAAMSMARLWRDQGKRQLARDLLAPVYGWFTEGFDTLDLKQSKALLDELAQ